MSPQSSIGHYRIISKLGEGGMGAVYRASDTKLGRDVALKVLPDSFIADADRTTRFAREAQVLASLNHPNIAAIYGVEERTLVLELVEGPTLAQRIAQGPIPLEEALPIAGEIAEALEYAHERGIIHRDLKPANVKVTAEGRVKVLDFGLAKALWSEPPATDPASSPTLTMRATMAGTIIGTAAYMSPEQAKGKPVDRRADIWAFGVVLYEMLAGQRAFEGDSAAELVGAVIHKEPDLGRIPPKFRRLLGKCLEKDPKQRLKAIGDWRLLLDEPTAVAAPSRARPTIGQWTGWAAAALLAVAAAWMWLRTPSESPRVVTRTSMILPTGARNPALSRDGKKLVYSAQGPGGRPILTLRMMDQLDGKPIAGTDAGVYPVFSPDGQWIAYLSVQNGYTLKKIPVTGGASLTISDELNGPPDWGLDDTIVCSSSTGLMRVPAAGGAARPLTTINAKDGESYHTSPQILPGGQAVLFTITHGSPFQRSFDSARIAVADLKTGAYRVLVNAGHHGRYVPTGHLVYSRGSTLFAVPFDVKRLKVTGPEAPVLDGVSEGQYTFSASSLLVFTAGGARASRPLSRLEWMDRQGVEQPLPEAPHSWVEIAVSPNGRLLAGSISESTSQAPRSDIWIYDLERHTLTRLTFEGSNFYPVWTRNGRWVTYSSIRRAKPGIYRVPADKSRQPEQLLAGEWVFPSSWTPDDKALLYTQSGGGKDQNWILPAADSGVENKPRLLSRTSFSEEAPSVSPDGKWVAYDSDESGKYEIYVEPFPGPGGKIQISTQGARGPVWSRNGRDLLYVNPDTMQLMAVDVTTTPAFRAGQPKALFKLTGASVEEAVFDVTPDANRFLVGRVQEGMAVTTFVTITNWFDDLRRRAPMDR
jgi:serine/threonine-protein kinase